MENAMHLNVLIINAVLQNDLGRCIYKDPVPKMICVSPATVLAFLESWEQTHLPPWVCFPTSSACPQGPPYLILLIFIKNGS